MSSVIWCICRRLVVDVGCLTQEAKPIWYWRSKHTTWLSLGKCKNPEIVLSHLFLVLQISSLSHRHAFCGVTNWQLNLKLSEFWTSVCDIGFGNFNPSFASTLSNAIPLCWFGQQCRRPFCFIHQTLFVDYFIVSFHFKHHNPSAQITTDSLSAFHMKNTAGVWKENLHDPLPLMHIAVLRWDNGSDVA